MPEMAKAHEIFVLFKCYKGTLRCIHRIAKQGPSLGRTAASHANIESEAGILKNFRPLVMNKRRCGYGHTSDVLSR